MTTVRTASTMTNGSSSFQTAGNGACACHIGSTSAIGLHFQDEL